MAREIVTWCDVCIDEGGERQPAESVQLAIGRTAAQLLDLCDKHEQQLVTPLAHVLDKFGRKLDDTLPPPIAKRPRGGVTAAVAEVQGSERNWPCPIPGCSLTMVTRQSLVGHLASRAHLDIKLSAYTQCPECDFTSDEPRLIGTHRKSKHGRTNLDDVLAVAHTRGLLPR